MILLVMLLFFFFKQKTAYEMRISDWSSDVCSSDLPDAVRQEFVRATRSLMRIMDERTRDGYVFRTDLRVRPDPGATPLAISIPAAETYYESVGQIGRASCRERVCQYG